MKDSELIRKVHLEAFETDVVVNHCRCLLQETYQPISMVAEAQKNVIGLAFLSLVQFDKQAGLSRLNARKVVFDGVNLVETKLFETDLS